MLDFKKIISAISHIGVDKTPERYAGEILETLCIEFGFCSAAAFLNLSGDGRNKFRSAHHNIPGFSRHDIEPVLDQLLSGPASEALKTASIKTVRSRAAGVDPKWCEITGDADVKTFVWVPLICEDEPYGLLTLCAVEGDALSKEAFDVLEAAASVISRLVLCSLRAHGYAENPSFFYETAAQIKFISDLMENSGQPFAASFADGRLIISNGAFADLIGYSQQEMKELSRIDITPFKYIKSSLETVKNIDKNKNLFIYEKEFAKKDGTTVPVEISAHPIYFRETSELCYLAFVRDISDRKRSECESLNNTRNLEKLVAERTREIAASNDALRNMLFAERVAADIFNRFIDLEPEKFDAELSATLRDMGRFFGVDRCKMLLFSNDFKYIDNSYEWCDEGVTRVDNRVLTENLEVLIPVIKKLRAREIVNITDADNSNSIIDSSFWKLLRIKSIICFPLFVSSGFGGVFVLDTEKEVRQWTDKQISSMKLIIGAFEGVIVHFKARRSLEESREIFRTFMNNFTEPAFIKDIDASYVFVNKAFEVIAGKPETEILGKTSSDIFGTEYGLKFVNQDQKMLHDDLYEDVEFESNIILPDGSRKKHLVRKFVISRSDSPPLIGGIAFDISERKKIEELLTYQTEFLQSLIDALPHPIMFQHVYGQYIGCNAAFENFFGLVKHDILTKNPLRIISGKELEQYNASTAKLLARGGNSTGEYRVESPGGAVHYAALYQNSFLNPDGKIGGIVSIIIDMTERKKMENCLYKSEQRYRNLIEFAHEGYWMIDTADKTVFVNKRMCEILGYNEKEFYGKHPGKFTDKTNAEIALSIISKVHEGIKSATSLEFIHKNGNRVFTFLNASPVYDDDGFFIGSFALVNDMTRQKLLENEVDITKKELLKNYSFYDVAGKSQAMTNIFESLHVVADADCNILIEGPSGTGKNLIAKVIHTISKRKKMPFVVVNCGTLPESLLESELFGYSRGAFTGADRDKPGKFAAASGGMIFLDEIGEMPLNLQVKLLRVLEDKCYEPIGSNKTVKADVKIIAATNRDLQTLVNEVKFRYDLYYRLKIVNFTIPPLKDRPEDIEVLLEHFIRLLNDKYNKNINGVSTEVFRLLKAYDFPGNIRELKNIIERAFIFCNGALIELQHLAPEYQTISKKYENSEIRYAGAPRNTEPYPESPVGDQNSTAETAESEKEKIIETISRCGNNKSLAAKTLGIDKTTLWRKMKKYGLRHLLEAPLSKEKKTEAKVDDATLSPEEETERAEIIDAVKKARGNKAEASRILNIDRTTLWRKMKKYNIA